MITIDGKDYDETKFSPELQNYLVVRQEIQVNATRHKLELEKKVEWCQLSTAEVSASHSGLFSCHCR